MKIKPTPQLASKEFLTAIEDSTKHVELASLIAKLSSEKDPKKKHKCCIEKISCKAD